MKLTRKQKSERNKKAKLKAHWKSYTEGQTVELRRCKEENQRQYEKLLSVLDDLAASKRIFKATENKAEIEKMTFAAELLNAAIKEVFESGYSSIKPVKRNDREYKMTTGFSSSGTVFFDTTGIIK